jgi:hypothetical protein
LAVRRASTKSLAANFGGEQAEVSVYASKLLGDTRVNGKLKPTHEEPGGRIDENANPDDGVVNDSLGTVNTADSTGIDEERETGDAKRNNKKTRED